MTEDTTSTQEELKWLIFQYDWNVDRELLLERLEKVNNITKPDLVDLGLVQLKGYALKANGYCGAEGCASVNLVEHSKSVVWGRLYGVEDALKKAINNNKNMTLEDSDEDDGRYKRITLDFDQLEGLDVPDDKYKLYTYAASDSAQNNNWVLYNPPSPRYLDHIVKGLTEKGAHPDYIKYVQDRTQQRGTPKLGQQVPIQCTYGLADKMAVCEIGLPKEVRVWPKKRIKSGDFVQVSNNGKQMVLKVTEATEGLETPGSKIRADSLMFAQVSHDCRDFLGLQQEKTRQGDFSNQYSRLTIRSMYLGKDQKPESGIVPYIPKQEGNWLTRIVESWLAD